MIDQIPVDVHGINSVIELFSAIGCKPARTMNYTSFVKAEHECQSMMKRDLNLSFRMMRTIFILAL